MLTYRAIEGSYSVHCTCIRKKAVTIDDHAFAFHFLCVLETSKLYTQYYCMLLLLSNLTGKQLVCLLNAQPKAVYRPSIVISFPMIFIIIVDKA